MDEKLKEVFIGTRNLVVFDAESKGLHGDIFAIGLVVFSSGFEVASRTWAIDRHLASCRGDWEGSKWVHQNVPSIPVTNDSPIGMRTEFWDKLTQLKDAGCVIAADCPCPVEARLLEQCVTDAPNYRRGKCPYPLIDIMSLQQFLGYDESAIPFEGTRHHPADDSRHSGKQLIAMLKGYYGQG